MSVEKTDELFCGHTAHIIFLMRQRSDRNHREFAVRAVVEADHGDLVRNPYPLLQKEADHAGGDLVVITHECSTVVQDALDLSPRGVIGEETVLAFCIVPIDPLILQGKAQILSLIHI